MKFPFEKFSIWNLMRHPFDEETGDVHTRMSMRILSLIIFPFYVVMQVIMPLYYFPNFYYDKNLPLALAIILCAVVALMVWFAYVVIATITRFFTSLYCARLIRAVFGQVVLWLTKKESPKWVERKQRLDSIWDSLEITNAHSVGKELSLHAIINPSMDVDLVESSISSYMKSLNGKYNGNNIAKLFVTLCKTKVLATDTLAHFYRVMSSQYTDGKWVIPNVVQKYARELNALEDSKRGWQKEIMQKYFPQINLDELNTDNA